MSTRPRREEWYPLGYSSDPVPGDAGNVSHFAGVMRATETTLSEGEQALRPLMDGTMIGQTANTLDTQASALAYKLGLVRVRYEAAANALTTYGGQLADFQARSIALLESTRETASQLQQAKKDEWNSWFGLKAMAPGPDRDERIADYLALQLRRDDLQSQVDAAKAELARICQERDEDAHTAKELIEKALDASGLNDTLGDRVGEAFNRVTAWLDEHADEIASWLGKASVVLMAIAPFTGPAAPYLAIASRVVGLVGSAFSIYSGFRKAQRTGNWGEFAVTVGLSIVSTFGLGKAARRITAGAGEKQATKWAIQSNSFRQFLQNAGTGGKLSTLRKIGLFDTYDRTKQVQAIKWLVHDKAGLSYKAVSSAKTLVNWAEEEAFHRATQLLTDRWPRRMPLTVQRTNVAPMAVSA